MQHTIRPSMYNVAYYIYIRPSMYNVAYYIYFKNSLIIQEENTKKNHKRVVSLYVIKNHVNLHKL